MHPSTAFAQVRVMTHSLARSLVLAGTSGIFLPLSFPNYDLGLMPWLALVTLHVALAVHAQPQAE